ncbi:unnamed protein product [Absidia cylindrospora]
MSTATAKELTPSTPNEKLMVGKKEAKVQEELSKGAEDTDDSKVVNIEDLST